MNHEAILRELREAPEVEGDFATRWAAQWAVVHPGTSPWENPGVVNSGTRPGGVSGGTNRRKETKTMSTTKEQAARKAERAARKALAKLDARLSKLEDELEEAGMVKPRPGRGQEATLTRHLQNLREGRPLWEGIGGRGAEMEFDVRSTLDDGGA